MNVTFEHTTVIYDNDIAEVLIGFVNHILIAFDEDTLRRLVADYAEKSALDRYFVYTRVRDKKCYKKVEPTA
ncbi:hypothetical protein EEL36_14235 [Muribaculaceae bacterium Isolate-043 (Harlan)]|nr:hypothetical protein EEL36_14235 [Muribaculaceae bacterium Isolate-043 (Harlan)]